MRCFAAAEPVLRGLLLLLLVLAAPARAGTAAFGDWAVAVVAGDWRAAGGQPTNAFENARRDVTAGLLRAGFRAENMRQFAPTPFRPGDIEADPKKISAAWYDVTARARTGCLFYLTSHGTEQGVVVGAKGWLTPGDLDLLLDLSCGDRPTVVVISACHSGIFVPALAGANRMILAAARAERTSFGCGVDDRYPYFDDCIIAGLAKAPDFGALAASARGCVAAKERAMRLVPPSEPQTGIGMDFAKRLPMLSLRPD